MILPLVWHIYGQFVICCFSVITSYVADMCYISESFDLERFKIVYRHSGSLAVIRNVAKQILPFNWQSLSDRPDVTFCSHFIITVSHSSIIPKM